MPRKTPQESAERWARRMSQAGPDYQAGINRVSVAPGQAAANNVQGYVNGVNEAVSSGKWQQNVAAVPLEDWRRAAIEKGAPRLATGAQAAQSKVQAAHERIAPMLDRAANEISRMPRATVQDRIQRAVTHMTSMNRQATEGRRRGR